MKLSQDQIKFIDTYLKNSEIEFADVRMEMVDHVTEAVCAKMEAEALGFYDAFKNYMVVHKKELQQSHKKFTKQTDKKVWKKLFQNFFHPMNILIIVVSAIVLYFVINEDNKRVFAFLPYALIFAFMVFYFIVITKRKKQRFSGLERMALSLIIFHQLIIAFMNPFVPRSRIIANDTLFISLLVFFIGVTTAYVKLTLNLEKEYRNYQIT